MLFGKSTIRPIIGRALPREYLGGERFAADREKALSDHPVGTVVWRDFANQEGRVQRSRTEVYDYKTPYWRVRHGDGDWEELTRTEVERGRSLTPAEDPTSRSHTRGVRSGTANRRVE